MAGSSLCVLLLVSVLPASLAATVPVYGKFETCVQLQKQYQNPFNYSEVAVQGTFSGPDGKVTVDGFYYQRYNRSEVSGQEQLTADGSPQWCIRYSPRQTGSYNVTISVTDSSGTSTVETTSFQAEKALDARGFIKVGKNKIHFQYDNGSTYYPVGENVCWVSQKGTYDYDMYFSKLGAVGVNYARLWLTDSGWDDLAVEIAVANFSLPNTWRLDYVVELAEHKGIHLLMCTESFNYFCTRITAPCDWNKNCYYNTKFGGFLEHPEDFFTDSRAKADYKNRLRYLVARYGYSTSVFAWEFFNEVDITDNYQTSVQTSWNQEMADYLHSVDTYDHLISTSYSNSNGDEQVQALPGLDFTMTHNYGSSDIAADTAQYPYAKLQMFSKPSYVAEYGIGDEGEDKEGVSLHNGLWAPLFSLAAGTCMTWWWDSWVDPNNLYPIFQPFSTFVSRLDLASYSWSRVNASSSKGSAVRVWGMEAEAERVMAWVQDDCLTWTAQHKGKQCYQRSNVTVSLDGCQQGKDFTGHWYSTSTGKLISLSHVQCSSSNTLMDTIPSFMGDIAVIYALD